MATLVVRVDDALLERITDAAQERGEDMEHLIVEVLTQAFPLKTIDDAVTVVDEMTAVLAPIWAEQDRQEPGSEPATSPRTPQPTHSDDGTDLTLIRWMLSLTPLERLRTAQRYARSAQRLRNAPRRVRL
ncbi:MAG: hypothetical protein JWN14_4264 [Chthonomonadales bacterium]|nr:hypothetical protein [Chthonomonadales bacterium]